MKSVSPAARGKKVLASTQSRVYLRPPTDQRAGFIFGYACMPVEQIGKGVHDLVQVYRSKYVSA